MLFLRILAGMLSLRVDFLDNRFKSSFFHFFIAILEKLMCSLSRALANFIL